MQKIYRAKYFLTLKNIKIIFRDKVSLINMDAGLSILIEVHAQLPEAELIKKAADINIFIKGGTDTYYVLKNKPKSPIVFIGFGNLSNEQIPKVLTSLKKAWFNN